MRHLSNNLRGTVLPLLLLRVERRASSSLPLHCCSFPPRIFPFFFPSVSVDSISLAHLEFAKKKQGSDKFQPRFDRGSPLLRDSERFRIIASRRMQMKTARSILNIRDLPVYPTDSNCFFFSPSRERERREKRSGNIPSVSRASLYKVSYLHGRKGVKRGREGEGR